MRRVPVVCVRREAVRTGQHCRYCGTARQRTSTAIGFACRGIPQKRPNARTSNGHQLRGNPSGRYSACSSHRRIERKPSPIRPVGSSKGHMSRADEESAILALLHEIADKERAETADGNTYWTAPQIKQVCEHASTVRVRRQDNQRVVSCGQIFTVRVTGEIIVQKNSSLTPLTLTIETNEGTQEELPVYLKQVQLQKNDYRDEQHLRRSEASYAVEFFFYEQVGRRLDVVHVPSLYALKRGVYDDGDDFFLLLEDYSKRLGQISGTP
eukprot:scaffold1594_cov401-Prasinococcus_capsulatus_cf.AAC.42